MRLKNSVFACVLALSTMPSFAGEGDGHQDRPSDPDVEKVQRIKEDLRKSDKACVFYGRVLDQSGNAIIGAQVEAHVTCFSLTSKFFTDVKDIHTETDAAGNFQITVRGRSIYVVKISKNGYEYLFSQNPTCSYEYGVEEGENPFVPNPQKPVIFRLRKRGAETFLITGEYYVRCKTDGNAELLEITPEWQDRTGNWLKQRWAGMTVSSKLLPDESGWILTFKGKHEDDAVLLLQGIAYEAPVAGYQASVEMKVPTQETEKAEATKKGWHSYTFLTNQEFYLVLRTAKPLAYSLVKLQLSPGNKKDGCRVNVKALTNPYGDRNLEPFAEEDLPYKVTELLTAETIAAFQLGKNPSKHADLSKMILDAKAKEASE